MKRIKLFKSKLKIIGVYFLAEALAFATLPTSAFAESASDYVSLPPLINTASSGDKANVLFILDNSNSMDEAPNGQAVGSANSGSKSEIARNAVKTVIDNFGDSTRMGLMAYKQSGISLRRLHDSQYDVSYNPSNYDPTFTGDRASSTKRFRVPNPSYGGRYIYYNVALPFYSNSNQYNRFCYSSAADFDNGSESITGPWDRYECWRNKRNTVDTYSGYSSYAFAGNFRPTDSDFAQNILDFGTNLTWQYVSRAWFSNGSPGEGYLHVEIDDVDSAQETRLRNKLAASQFTNWTDTPLRNAGLTPVEGSLRSAREYFNGTMSISDSETRSTGTYVPAPGANTCFQEDYVILVTDGLPSVDRNGNILTNTANAISRSASEAAALRAAGIRTYVIGFGLPTGVDGSLLDNIAAAGGTGTTYLANDSATLNAALESIFLSFSSRETNSASSAVVSTNARGEGVVFQALYSPKKTIGSTEISWVGDVYGIFFDENGLFREDTNQNAKLDDYATDRVAEYFFNTDEENTQVRLFISSDPAEPPDPSTDTPVATVDLDDLGTIWNGRDGLGDLSNVLTQRSYSASAATGRYIISSVDGSSTVDFIQISDTEIAALSDAQDAAAVTLADAQASLTTAQAQYDAAVISVADSIPARDRAIIERDLAQSQLSAAQASQALREAANNSAAANLASAQSNFATASEDYLTNYVDRFEDGAQAIVDFEGNVLFMNSPDISSGDEFGSLVQTLIDNGADPGNSTVDSAREAYEQAQSDLLGRQNTLVNEARDYDDEYFQAAENTRDAINNLANNGVISTADLNNVKANVSNVIAVSLGGIASANANVDFNSTTAARQNYINALVDSTGVDTSNPTIQSAITAYDDARSSELTTTSEFHGDTFNTIVSSTDTFFGSHYDVYNSYESIAPAESAATIAQLQLDFANQQLATAETEFTEAEEALTEAEGNIPFAQEQLVTSQEALDTFQAAYNSALAAYNLATSTANNSGTLLNYLDVDTVQKGYDVVKFVRGEDGLSGLRSRAIDYDGDGTNEVWRLGDIVHSSPTLVTGPSEAYDSIYRDRTYAAFRRQYKDRRQVLYVGSNDGMLHAFNAGFWNRSEKRFETDNSFLGGSGITQHPLGSELWSYVPRAALPHLQWLTDPNYAHTYYVDGNPISFDANIFTPSATHPHGWGTVLMIGMRFGGGDISVDSDADGTDDTVVSSSYMLFDVTDPEQPPSLIAEISHPSMGFTTSTPTVVKKRVRGTSFEDTTENEWYVAFGSGPTELDDASSTQNAGLFMYDLKAKSFVSGFAPLALEANSFVGDLTSYDENGDFVDDTLYFGVGGGTPSAGTNGRIKRTRLDLPSNASTSTLVDVGRPSLSAPGVTNDQFGRRWISFGTGRLFMAPDNVTTQGNKLFGIMEPVNTSGSKTWSTVSMTDVENVTDIDVYDNGDIERGGGNVEIPSGNLVENFPQLIGAIRDERAGWQRDLANDGSTPAARNFTNPAYDQSIIFFTSYQPSNNLCAPEGRSRLYGIDFRTGVADPFEIFSPGDDPNTYEGNLVATSVDLGIGAATGTTVVKTKLGSSLVGGSSTGVTDAVATNNRGYRTGRQSWRQLILD